MRQAALIAFLIVATGVAMFAVQNANPVPVRFGFWSLEMSLVVVILVAAAVGAIMAALVGLPGWFRDRRLLHQQARELDALRASQPLRTPGSSVRADPVPPRPPTQEPKSDPPSVNR